MELKFSETNPIIPILRLIIGIIFAITSVLWIIQMYSCLYLEYWVILQRGCSIDL